MRTSTSPGLLFKAQFINEPRLSIKEVAKRMDWKESILIDFLNGDLYVCKGVAKGLEEYTGASYKMWMNMQANHDKTIN